MIPKLPFDWKHGQILYFCEADKPLVITHVCQVKYRQGERVLLRVLNASHNMVLDPRSGVAKPFGVKLRLCWVGGFGPEITNFNAAIEVAQLEYNKTLWSQRKS
jgi:hypothetical protein